MFDARDMPSLAEMQCHDCMEALWVGKCVLDAREMPSQEKNLLSLMLKKKLCIYNSAIMCILLYANTSCCMHSCYDLSIRFDLNTTKFEMLYYFTSKVKMPLSCFLFVVYKT